MVHKSNPNILNIIKNTRKSPSLTNGVFIATEEDTSIRSVTLFPSLLSTPTPTTTTTTTTNSNKYNSESPQSSCCGKSTLIIMEKNHNNSNFIEQDTNPDTETGDDVPTTNSQYEKNDSYGIPIYNNIQSNIIINHDPISEVQLSLRDMFDEVNTNHHVDDTSNNNQMEHAPVVQPPAPTTTASSTSTAETTISNTNQRLVLYPAVLSPPSQSSHHTDDNYPLQHGSDDNDDSNNTSGRLNIYTPPQSLIPIDPNIISNREIINHVHRVGQQQQPSPATLRSIRINDTEVNVTTSTELATTSSKALNDVGVENGQTPTPMHHRISSNSGHHHNHNHHTRQPSIYSAIGSLEDPSSTSLRGWEDNISNRGPNPQGKGKAGYSSNYEFPSMSTLLAPQTEVNANRKRRSLLDSAASKLEDTVDANVQQQVHVQQLQPSQSENLQQKSKTKGKISGVLKTTTTNVYGDETKSKDKIEKKVTIDPSNDNTTSKSKTRKSSSRKHSNNNKNPIEMFRPSSDAYTPRMGKKEIKYKPAAMRTPVQQMASPLGTLSRPNFRDALRRVAMIIHQHIVKIERRFENHHNAHMNNKSNLTSMASVRAQSSGRGYGRRSNRTDDGLFSTEMKEIFSEDRYIIPRYKCTMVRVPMAVGTLVCGIKHIREKYDIPSENEIYEFAHQLFKSVQLSSECSIVGLIYVERLMETAKVPLLAETWRPIFMCGLLMASKVWQDLSSWNIEFAGVYPRYSLESINRLELQFLRMIKWDLYISSSQYAKYYFALRSLVEKPDFRQRYNRMVGGVDMVQASQARKIQERSTMVKEEVILQLSRSM